MFRFQKQSSGKKPQSVGFYIALAVCLTAIGASAWTTFDSVMDLRRSASVAPSSVQQVNRDVSGVPASEPASSAQTSSAAPASNRRSKTGIQTGVEAGIQTRIQVGIQTSPVVGRTGHGDHVYPAGERRNPKTVRAVGVLADVRRLARAQRH